MSLRSWFVQKFAGAMGVPISITDPKDAKAWSSVTGGFSSYAGKSVTEISAMQVATVFSCVRLLSEVFGSLPLSIYVRDPRGRGVQSDHYLNEILGTAPNTDMTGVEFVEAQMSNLTLHGNGYALKETSGRGTVVALNPMPAVDTIPQRAKDGSITYRYNDRGKWETYPAEKIFHIKGFGANGLVGYSPIAYARQTIGFSLAAEEFGSRVFSNGAKPGGFLKFPAWLTPEQRELAQTKFDEYHTGLENAHRLMLLEGGIEYQDGSGMLPLDDMEFLATRQFETVEICRFFRVQPHLVFDLSRSTNNNIEEQSLEFVKYTLAPYLRRWEQAVARSLLSMAERQRYYLKFNLNGLLRGDIAARGEFLGKMLANSVYTPNEVRMLEDENPLDQAGMDDTHIQINMAPTRILEEIARKDPQPVPRSTPA